jgi:hypothetical protein
MQITLGGQPVACALAEAENLRRLSLPMPPNFGRANSLLNPLGEAPARGWFLLLRQHFNKLNVNALLTLLMDDGLGHQVGAAGLVITREPTCITPSGDPFDPNACLMVEVADARWRCHNPYYSIPADKQYNVPASGWKDQYYQQSLNGSSPWTWDQMVGDLWGLMSAQLGNYPGLPITPDGVPTSYRFLGVSAWQSLCLILDTLGCAVAWNAATSTYSIVQIGGPDLLTTTALTLVQGRVILDRQMPAVFRGRAPSGVRVHFHRVQQYYGTEPATEQDNTQFVMNSVYTVDVTAPAAFAGEPGVFHPLWDDLPAIYDVNGVLQNSADLTTRAQNRSAAYFATILGTGGSRLHQIFTGIVPVSPSATLRGVIWRQDLQGIGDADHPGGLLTEVFRVPTVNLRVSDDGMFEEPLESSDTLRPPDYRTKEPIYPDLLTMVNVTVEAVDANGNYGGKVEVWDSANKAWVTRETCKVKPANNEILACGHYLARLIGYDSTAGETIYAVGLRQTVIFQALSQTTQPVIMADGSSDNAYPAQSLKRLSGAWTPLVQGWFIGANGETPGTSRHLGMQISCATLQPPAAPALSQTPGGLLSPTTYYVQITYTTPRGETPPSAEVSLSVSAGNLLVVTASTYPNATSWNVYVGTTPGAETQQASGIAIGTPWTEPTSGLIAGGPVPNSNPDLPVWSGEIASSPARVEAITSTPSTVYLGRQITDGALTSGSTTLTSASANFQAGDVGSVIAGAGIYSQRTVGDGVLNGTTTLTSATASFTSADVGQPISGVGIPGGMTISSVTNATTVVMSAAATILATNVTVAIGQATTISSVGSSTSATMSKAALSNQTNDAIDIATGTIQAYAAQIATWSNLTGGWSLGSSVWLYEDNGNPPISGGRYHCRLLGADDTGKAIWDYGRPVSAPASIASLPGDVTLTPSTGGPNSLIQNWATLPGMSLTLGPGTYLIWANVTGELETSDPDADIGFMVFDTTNSLQVGNITMCVASGGSVTSGALGLENDATGTLVTVYTSTQPFTLTVLAACWDTTNVGSTTATIHSGSNLEGGTSIGAMKIAF